ncbi:hypothetical protein Tco_0169853 [Tanacetum coccineum]
MANLPPNHNEFAPAAEAAPDNQTFLFEEEDPEKWRKRGRSGKEEIWNGRRKRRDREETVLEEIVTPELWIQEELDRTTWPYHHLRRWSIMVLRESITTSVCSIRSHHMLEPEAQIGPITQNDPRDLHNAARDAATAPRQLIQ